MVIQSRENCVFPNRYNWSIKEEVLGVINIKDQVGKSKGEENPVSVDKIFAMSGLVQLPTGTKKGNGLMEKQSSTVQVGSTAGADPDAYSSDITDLIKFVEYIKEVDLTNVEPLESLSMDCHVELHEAECDIDQQFSSHSVEEEVAGTALMDMLTENSKSKREGNYFVVET